MAVSVFPALCTGLMSVATSTCPSAEVYYAFIDDDASGDAFVVNATDVEVDDWSDAVTEGREWESVGRNADVHLTAEIPCVIRSWSGDGGSAGQLEVMQAVYALAEAFGASLRTDPTVGGIAGLMWVQITDSSLRHRADPDTGSQAELAFSVSYQALI